MSDCNITIVPRGRCLVLEVQNFDTILLKGVQPYTLQIRVTGFLLIGVSIIEFAVGAAAYGFLSRDHNGGWWGALLTFFLGIISQNCDTKLLIRGILFTSIVTGVICIVALSIDGTHAGAILNSGCYSTNSGETYGKQDKLSDAYNCPYKASADCICSANTKTCYAYYLSVGSNCETLYSTYYGELATSSVFNAVLFILCGFQFLFCLANVGRPEAPVEVVTPYVLPSTGFAPCLPAVVPADSPPTTLYPLSYAPVSLSYAPVNTDQHHLQQQVLSDGQTYEQPGYDVTLNKGDV